MDPTTAAAIRISRLHNLEVLLNALAHSAEIAGICLGIFLIVKACRCWTNNKGSAVMNFTLAVIVAPGGLLAPGLINWLVAPAHGPCLF
jgi:hypothetical protein